MPLIKFTPHPKGLKQYYKPHRHEGNWYIYKLKSFWVFFEAWEILNTWHGTNKRQVFDIFRTGEKKKRARK